MSVWGAVLLSVVAFFFGHFCGWKRGRLYGFRFGVLGFLKQLRSQMTRPIELQDMDRTIEWMEQRIRDDSR